MNGWKTGDSVPVNKCHTPPPVVAAGGLYYLHINEF